jgi:Mg2+/Co2+ transporter CorB
LNDIPLSILFAILIALLICSAFFSSSETGMMSLNRYRLRHLAKKGHKGAIRASELLERPDRLIGVILTGNNLVNFAAASISTILAQRIWHQNPELGITIMTVVFTMVVLIFAELTPKTLAATHPEKVAFPATYILRFLHWALAPFVIFVNAISNGLLKLMNVNVDDAGQDHLSREELRTLVHEAGGMIPKRHQHMLLGILDLERVSVNDIMIPKHDVIGIDLEDDWPNILETLRTSQHTRLPIFKGSLNHVIGVLHLRSVARLLGKEDFSKSELLQETKEPYYIPENTPLHTQLYNFQREKRRFALVVDEYGDIQGVATLEDILEEIVGEFTTDIAAASRDIHPQGDGSYIINGTAGIRDINKALGWDLPTNGPKTFNGLVIEILEHIPDSNVCLKIKGRYLVEILKISENTVKSTKVRRMGKTKGK